MMRCIIIQKGEKEPMGKFDAVKKTEQILSEYKAVKQNICNLELLKAEVDEYKTRGMKCINYEDMGSLSGMAYSPDTIGKKVVMVDEMERIVNSKLKSEKRIIKYVDMSLNTLKESQRQVIEMKYIDGLCVNEICEKLYRSESWVHKVRKKSVKQLAIALFGSPSELLRFYNSEKS